MIADRGTGRLGVTELLAVNLHGCQAKLRVSATDFSRHGSAAGGGNLNSVFMVEIHVRREPF